MGQPQGSIPHESRVIRPLSHLEAYKSSLHLLRQHCGTVVSCRYSIADHVENTKIKTAVERSVAISVLQHPLMQVALSNEDSSRPFWISLRSIDFTRQLQWQFIKRTDDYTAQLETTIHNTLHKWFTELDARPGWRLHILQDESNPRAIDVVFCWHHAWFDGMSAKLFHRTLARNLNDEWAQSNLSSLVDGQLQLGDITIRFPPPIESLRKISMSWGFTLLTIYRELFPAFLVARNPADVGWAPIRAAPYRTESRLITIDRSTLESLLAACREHSTTLTGLLNVLPLFSLARQLGGDKMKALSSVTAIDLRQFMPLKPSEFPWHEPAKTMDNEVSLIEENFDAGVVNRVRRGSAQQQSENTIKAKLQDMVWLLARRNRQKIRDKLSSDMENDPVGLMHYVKDWRELMKSKLSKPRARSWGVTNLGSFESGELKQWSIQGARFHLSAEVNAPAFHISAVSVQGGDLCVDIGWQEGIMDNAIGERLAVDIEQWLKYLAA
ncbi:hypothetical protein LTR84_001850 [Exophiala bonariae]|uniref:Alcohol acetyltransferase n=1 Tax=Exophiala bonariae TaxID=1690606 RepID=A0AAV9NCV5_9EURO|nr:hypothetical protein LTR84_001850 [Exophiala bonariae]